MSSILGALFRRVSRDVSGEKKAYDAPLPKISAAAVVLLNRFASFFKIALSKRMS